MDILELPSAWRQDYLPASFRNARFHVEAGAVESGRRIVLHEFPKKDDPYAEDMGRKARDFTVRGYLIQYPKDLEGNELYSADYRPARNALIKALETEGPAALQLPLLPQIMVVVKGYRLVEEDRTGGYCVFDMMFVEYGWPPTHAKQNSASQVTDRANDLGKENQRNTEREIEKELAH
jgi:prophage DNA circulation protein